jgi:hypothetical protein
MEGQGTDKLIGKTLAEARASGLNVREVEKDGEALMVRACMR